MTLAAPEPMIGTKIYAFLGVPTAEDESSYGALLMSEILGPDGLPALVETAESGEYTRIRDGVRRRFNGAKGVEPFDIAFEYIADDAGQLILRGNSNGATELTIRIDYPHSGGTTSKYVWGVCAGPTTGEARTNTPRTETYNFRPSSIATTVES